jgi:hypothetical protein
LSTNPPTNYQRVFFQQKSGQEDVIVLDTGRPAVIEIDECGALGEVFMARSGAKKMVCLVCSIKTKWRDWSQVLSKKHFKNLGDSLNTQFKVDGTSLVATSTHTHD